MTANTVGFIGGGRVARIILGGWQRAGSMPAEVVVSEPNADVLDKLKRQFASVRSTPGRPLAAGANGGRLRGRPPARRGRRPQVPGRTPAR